MYKCGHWCWCGRHAFLQLNRKIQFLARRQCLLHTYTQRNTHTHYRTIAHSLGYWQIFMYIRHVIKLYFHTNFLIPAHTGSGIVETKNIDN